jgi:glutamine synthetase type III
LDEKKGCRKMSEKEYFNVADIFGENVFNDAVMRERLPKKVYKKLHEVMEEGKELDLETADVVAHEMKEWAIEKGATHYTHWFQPLTGVTAEKHDSFITAPMPNGKVLMSFSGKELIKGVMIESYLEEGCQSIGADQIYGKSITDPCLGWEDTERLIYKIAEEC